MRVRAYPGMLAAAMLAATSLAQDHPMAFVGAKIIPVAGEPIDDGVLLIRDGRILAVGTQASVNLPIDVEIIELTGRVIMPGLVDTHSHIGRPQGGDRSSPIQPEARVIDSIHVLSPAFMRARAGGITTVNVMPGSGHLLSGQTVYLKLRRGKTIEDLAMRDADGNILGGIKMANGTNSRRDPPFPGTRAKAAALVRAKYIEAREYREKIDRAGGDPEKMPPRDLGLEALLEVLDGKRIVHHHTHRADDILTVLRLKREFGFRVVLHHVSEGWKVADRIAAANVPCSIILIDSPGGKLEARDLLFKTGGVLERAGVTVAYHTDDPITDSRLFLRMAALGVRAGMSHEGALRALTLNGAAMLGLDERVGSLEPRKDADFVILDGDPLSVYTKVLQTWVEGVKVFDRSDPKDHLYAVGGYGAGEDVTPDVHCFDAAP